MSQLLKIHYGHIVKNFKIETCHNCDEFVNDLYECDTCGSRFCADCIIQEGNGTDDINFICINCQNRRMGV